MRLRLMNGRRGIVQRIAEEMLPLFVFFLSLHSGIREYYL